jgi:predicted methyltransferase
LSPFGHTDITVVMNTPVRPAVALPLAFVVALSLCPAAHAQLGARSAAEWVRMLDAQARVSKLRVDDVVTALALRPGAKVADIGAGSGVFTLPLAGAVTASRLPAGSTRSTSSRGWWTTSPARRATPG